MPKSRSRISTTTGLVTLLLALSAPASADLLDVDHADDICAPSDDPCVISERIVPVDLATIDFGTRTLRIENGGLLEIGTNTVSISAGDVSISTGGARAVRLGPRPSDNDLFIGGWLRLTAQGTCSDDPAVLCTRGEQCASLICQATSGNVELGGPIDGTSSGPASVVEVNAAGDVLITAPINVSTSDPETDGGEVLIVAQGNIDSRAKLIARGGRLVQGGEIELTAGGNLSVSETLNVNGGDFDGGFVCLEADGDITLDATIHASSSQGEGFGGEVRVIADGDIAFAPRSKILVRGHRSSEAFGGDGGVVEVVANGSLTMPEKVRIDARPGSPDGFAGLVELSARETMTIGAKIRADSRGRFGGGGCIEIESITANVVLEASMRATVKGHAGGGGDIDVRAATGIIVDGAFELSARAGGIGGRIYVAAESVEYLGKIRGHAQPMDFSFNSSVTFDACDVTIKDGASISLRGELTEVALDCTEQCTVEPLARLRQDESGATRVYYRSDGPLPVIEANIIPAAQLFPRSRLPCTP